MPSLHSTHAKAVGETRKLIITYTLEHIYIYIYSFSHVFLEQRGN
jgi:hypothetical protein